jgi:hypothetical protein
MTNDGYSNLGNWIESENDPEGEKLRATHPHNTHQRQKGRSQLNVRTHLQLVTTVSGDWCKEREITNFTTL